MNFSETRQQEGHRLHAGGGIVFKAEGSMSQALQPFAADRLQRLLDRLARPAALTGADLRRAFGPRLR
jgi:hypothetical protein